MKPPKDKKAVKELLALEREEYKKQLLLAESIDTFLPTSNADDDAALQEHISEMPLEEAKKINEILACLEYMDNRCKKAKEHQSKLLVIRQLNYKFGSIESELERCINNLPLAKIEILSEALLDFRDKIDLECWLREERSVSINGD